MDPLRDLDLPHHLAFVVHAPTGIKTTPDTELSFSNTFFNFFKADYEGMVEHLGRVNWYILEIPSIDEATKKFYNVIYDALEIYVPRRRARSSTFPP